MDILIGVVVVGAVIFALTGMVIIRQHEQGLIETLGKYTATYQAGLKIIVPFFQTMRKVDMREQVLDVPPQEVITKDNAVVQVDAVIYFQVTDPFKVTYNVVNFYVAMVNLAQTTLRNIIGEMELDSTLTGRDKINAQLRTVLDDATDKWGVKVTRVELKSIEPPRDITDSMSKQLKAERERRAAILEADGVKQSEVLKAEGERQSSILRAEGQKQSAILEAEGRAEAMRRVAEAKQFETETVFGAIQRAHPDQKVIALKYLESLERIADGQANKVFLPLESTGILGSLAGIKEIFDRQK